MKMEINVYGPILTGFADDLRRTVRRVPKHEPIELHISSPGGSLAEGVTAYNVLRSAPNEVHAYLDGDAFSAATLLVCSADYAEMPSNVLMMVHDPWVPTLSPCTLDEITKTGKYLRATRNQVVEIYHDKTKLAKTALAKMMRDETYLTAEEALGKGFIHNVTRASNTVQNRPLTDYVNVRDRERLASMLGGRKIPRDVASLLKSIGV
jgi:ATP-dependent Clp protease, protease subunit